jgi:hypothetical protein
MKKIKYKDDWTWIEGNPKFKFKESTVISYAKCILALEDIYYLSAAFRHKTKRTNDAFRLLVKEYREQKPEIFI